MRPASTRLSLCLFACAVAASGASADLFHAELLNGFAFRNVGPFRAGGWVSAVAVPDTPSRAHLYTIYAGARHGGVWKSTNNGVTFDPVLDSQGVFAVGAIAVAPSNADIVWVGAGDNSAARSAYPGDGVYKSTDGGATWQNMGLKDSHHIARIIVHPANPDVVLVAAMGHLFTPNEERGVFKTADGGRTWKRVLYIGDTTGAVDLVADPRDPNVLYAAMYEVRRFPWRLVDGGARSGIHKTTDGGATWQKLETGLPSGQIGRIGIDLCFKNPDVVYAVVDNLNSKGAPPAGTRPPIFGGEVYRSDDAGRTWRKMNSERDDVSRKSGYAFNQLRVAPDNPDRIYVTGSNLITSNDGGKTWIGLGFGGGGGGAGGGRPAQSRIFARAFGDFRTLWIDPQDSLRMIAASDGGVFVSYDGGRTSNHLSSIRLGEVYGLAVDLESPYNIYAGLQDHENWKGPSNGWSGSAGVEDWITTGSGDGMYNQVDPTDSRWLYNTQEFGQPRRVDQKTRTRKLIAPQRAEGQPRLRVNWVAPVRLSPHDPKTVYFGAQVLFRSTDRGDHWQEISPDLTTNDPEKISPPGSAIQHCTITTLDESRATAGVIWAGTDDGKVQVTRDGGARWTDVTPNIAAAGGPEDAWVTRVFGSHHSAGTAYIAKSRLRQDDFRPFLFRTTDFGATWKPIHSDLPLRSINVVVEDHKNPDLLFVGNDAGVFVSIDGGGRWVALKANMPVVPVHDIVIHPREGDLVAGTYGRGIWVTNIAPLREMSEEILAKPAHLFEVRPVVQRKEGAWGNYRLYGDGHASTPNEPNGAVFVYHAKAAGKLSLAIADSSGSSVRTIETTARAGINRTVWDLDDAKGQPSPVGEYSVTLQIGNQKHARKVQIVSRAPDDEPRQRRRP